MVVGRDPNTLAHSWRARAFLGTKRPSGPLFLSCSCERCRRGPVGSIIGRLAKTAERGRVPPGLPGPHAFMPYGHRLPRIQPTPRWGHGHKRPPELCAHQPARRPAAVYRVIHSFEKCVAGAEDTQMSERMQGAGYSHPGPHPARQSTSHFQGPARPVSNA